MKCIKIFLATFVLTLLMLLIIDFVRFPECYISTWKYQLENEIKAGDPVAKEYYLDNYVKNGRELFN